MITKFKSFEQKSDIDPYGEENWNDEIDLSEADLDEQVKILRELILDDPKPLMSEFDVDFHYTKMEYDDNEYENGNALDEIFDIFLNEDGEIIFTGIINVYVEETDDYMDYNVYYTIDKKYPIFIKKQKVIL
jgi:hypothetical protein